MPGYHSLIWYKYEVPLPNSFLIHINTKSYAVLSLTQHLHSTLPFSLPMFPFVPPAFLQSCIRSSGISSPQNLLWCSITSFPYKCGVAPAYSFNSRPPPCTPAVYFPAYFEERHKSTYFLRITFFSLCLSILLFLPSRLPHMDTYISVLPHLSLIYDCLITYLYGHNWKYPVSKRCLHYHGLYDNLWVGEMVYMYKKDLNHHTFKLLPPPGEINTFTTGNNIKHTLSWL